MQQLVCDFVELFLVPHIGEFFLLVVLLRFTAYVVDFVYLYFRTFQCTDNRVFLYWCPSRLLLAFATFISTLYDGISFFVVMSSSLSGACWLKIASSILF